MKNNWLVLGLMGIMLVGTLKAQPYRLGIGARMGPYLGLTVKGNLDEHSGLELIAETRRKGFLLTGLYEYHIAFDRVDGLRLYVGAGAHLAYLNSAFINAPVGTTNHRITMGLDGIVGLEYTFPRAPINISFDFKPMFNYWDRWRVYADNFALAIRYVFQ